MSVMRLDKFFSSQELLTRKEIRPLLKMGAIRLNGETVSSPEQKVDTDRDQVTLHGEPVVYKPYIYLMLNKPKGVVSSTDDRKNPTVLDLVPPNLFRSGLFPAGRLDKDTTGFVLLTNDGDFAHRILSPKSHVQKTYEAVLDAPLTEEGIRRLKEGIVLADGSECMSADVQVLWDGAEPLVRIVICEGKYHQIKRMFGVLGIGVNELTRRKIGGLELDAALAPGECREMLHKEIEKILVV